MSTYGIKKVKPSTGSGLLERSRVLVGGLSLHPFPRVGPAQLLLFPSTLAALSQFSAYGGELSVLLRTGGKIMTTKKRGHSAPVPP